MTTMLSDLTEQEAAAVLDDAWRLLDIADRANWPDSGYDDIADAAQELRDSLELHEEAAGLGWGQDSVLAGYAAGVAEDITRLSAALVSAMRRHGVGETASSITHQAA
jgi:hypothetical protein